MFSDYLNASHMSKVVDLQRVIMKRCEKLGHMHKVTFPFLDNYRNMLKAQYLGCIFEWCILQTS